MSEGLANHVTQLYTYSRDLSSQVVTLNTSLETTQATVDQTREEANIFDELRNDTKNSVQLALNQVSQLQIASSTLCCIHVRSELIAQLLLNRYCTESSE